MLIAFYVVAHIVPSSITNLNLLQSINCIYTHNTKYALSKHYFNTKDIFICIANQLDQEIKWHKSHSQRARGDSFHFQNSILSSIEFQTMNEGYSHLAGCIFMSVPCLHLEEFKN